MTPLESSWNEIFMLFARIFTISMLIPVGVALLNKKYWNKPLKVIFQYALLSFLLNAFELSLIWAVDEYTEFFQPALTYWEIEYFFFLSILYYLKDFIFLSIFYSLIFPSKTASVLVLWTGRILAIAAVINYLFIEGYNVFGKFNPGADAVFLVSLPVLYLWLSQRYSLRIPLKKNPYLWISLGLLLPNLLSLFLYFTGDFIHSSDFILYMKIYTVKNIFEIIGQILIAIGFVNARFSRFLVDVTTSVPPIIGS